MIVNNGKIIHGGTSRHGSPSPPVVFAFDLTQPALPSGIVAARAGKTGAIYAMQTPTTATAITGDDVFDLATTNPSLGGHWAFGPYTNFAPAPFDFTNAGWTQDNGPFPVSHNAATAPDGTLTADTLTDNSAASVQSIKMPPSTTLATRTNSVCSVWVQDNQANPPTSPGAVFAYPNFSYGNRPYVNSLGSGAAWRRVSSLETNAYTTTAPFSNIGFFLSMAGSQPVAGSQNPTFTPSATGAVNAWGAFAHDGFFDYPLVVGSTGALSLSVDAAHLGVMLDANGDLDVEVGLLAEYFNGGSSSDGDGWLWSMATPSKGTIGISYTQGTVHTVNVNGTTPMGGINGGVMPMTVVGTGIGAGEHRARFAFKPSNGNYYLRIMHNGCFEQVGVVNGATGPIGTPTSFYLGSNLGTANRYEARFTSLKSYTAAQTLSGSTSINAAEGAIIGDSTSSAYSTVLSTVGEWVYTVAESRTRPGINSLAITAKTAADQLLTWQASPSRGDANLKWVYIMVGTNDINASASEATIVSRLQAIINDINTNNPNAKIILAPMLPFGFTSTALATWTAVNNDIVGTGTITITGTNLTRLPLWSALDDGTGKLLTQYQHTDGQHENDAGRRYVGYTTLRAKLQAMGLL